MDGSQRYFISRNTNKYEREIDCNIKIACNKEKDVESKIVKESIEF